MIPVTLRELARVTHGSVEPADADLVVTAPATVDSRQATPGSLFAALVGEHADGHAFAADAADRGAVAALVSTPVPRPTGVVVPDVVEALGLLAAHVLRRLRTTGAPTVVAVTGSSGKTSTKDLLGQVLARAGETLAPISSFNNEIGLPLTVLRTTESTRYLVLEMSARGSGHIAALCAVAPIDIGVVLNVGSAHIGEFGSRAAIAAAKAELLGGVVDGGVVVLNADDELVAAMRPADGRRVVTFGRSDRAQVRAVDVEVADDGRPAFRLVTPRGESEVRLRLIGEHHVGNALAAAAAALEAGLEPGLIATSLGEAVPLSKWRMELRHGADGVTVVNDAYNANPESMRAALAALVRLGQGRRTWAVLGQMAELGDAADREHDELGRHCAQLGLTRLVTVGAEADAIARSAAQAGVAVTACADIDDAVAVLRDGLRPGDVVLVKASRSVGLERLADVLAPGEPEEAA